MTTPLDPHYIPAFSIEDVLLDKDTGAPLSGGQVFFYQDNNRGMLKPVYQLTGTSPNYSFTQLPNPVILSSIGTFEDDMGNPVIPYFYPFDAARNVELYYVVVLSSGDVPQFVRQAVPYIPEDFNPVESSASFQNSLSNPQFAEVLFITPITTLTITAAVLQEIAIAADWDLIVTGTGTITLTQITPFGSLNIATNPGTILGIEIGVGISLCNLRQRLYGAPALWASGNLSTSFTAASLSAGQPFININYVPQSGSGTSLINKQLNSINGYTTFNGQATLPSSSSGNKYPSSYVDIVVVLPPGFNIGITSIQVAFTGEEIVEIVPFDQESNARQIDYLFHYYKPELFYKPIPSFLVGWDFPLNPCQINTVALNPGQPVSTVAATAIGVNKSKYVWDQTIIFQSADSGIGVTRGSAGEIVLTAAITTQMALIQYLPAIQARKLLNGRMAVNIAAKASALTDATVTLWYTVAGSLPNINPGTNNSLVATLGINGKPTAFNGTWLEVPRSNRGDATFTIGTSGDITFNDYNFSGWDLEGIAGGNTATFFAIVIGTASVTSPNTVSFYSVGLNAGDIATRPAPQTQSQVLSDCQYYFETTYDTGTLLGAITSTGIFSAELATFLLGTGNDNVVARQFRFNYNTAKRTAPAVGVFDEAGTASNATIILFQNGAAVTSAPQTFGSFWTTTAAGLKSVCYNASNATSLVASAAGTAPEGFLHMHFTIDARLGII
jgi:hypothetical protein